MYRLRNQVRYQRTYGLFNVEFSAFNKSPNTARTIGVRDYDISQSIHSVAMVNVINLLLNVSRLNPSGNFS
jgi:hypothetical protein